MVFDEWLVIISTPLCLFWLCENCNLLGSLLNAEQFNFIDLYLWFVYLYSDSIASEQSPARYVRSFIQHPLNVKSHTVTMISNLNSGIPYGTTYHNTTAACKLMIGRSKLLLGELVSASYELLDYCHHYCAISSTVASSGWPYIRDFNSLITLRRYMFLCYILAI